MIKDIYAYAGNILRINLSDGKIRKDSTLDYSKEWLGSSGIAIKILYDELKPWVTPYDPANKLIIGAGVLLGTPAPGANKMNISTLGPITGGWASSCSDSFFGLELKYAGYDTIIIEGRAHHPVYIWIDNNNIEIRDASHFWGKTTWETLEMSRKELRNPNLHIISIGPAGENLVRGANIIQDRGRAFGRCGTGAVMGSKNLKMIAVKGSGSIKVANENKFMGILLKIREKFERLNKLENPMHEYGTLSVFYVKRKTGTVNYKNFQYYDIPDALAMKIDPIKTIEKYKIAQHSFPGCALNGCGKHLYLNEGPYAGLTTENNQWEVFENIQTRLAIQEPTFMVKANALCNQLGVDVDLIGGAVGWAMECYQRNIIDQGDTDGLELNWGNAEVVLELIKKICYRQGFGNILSEGCVKASSVIGRNSEYFALHNKGQDLYEVCRGALGWCLGACTSTRGGGHTTGAVTCEAIPENRKKKENWIKKAKSVYGVYNPHMVLEYEGKAKMVLYMEILHRINNCLGVCHFNTTWSNPEYIDLSELMNLYTTATGNKTSLEDFKKNAIRQLNLEKAFNLKFTNYDRKDDMPNLRDMQEPIKGSSLEGWKIDKEKYNKMMDEYYEIHGWDKQNSFPTKKTLIDLGLAEVAEDLKRIGKIGKTRKKIKY
ncbi:hypothetical protein A2V47_02225 [Candidatus Atribacteria bacterium RBG_19FT_COMBO_35_14]|uniref:Aldehyde ferredoxin oxidoreductase N-terminal domain-containing protein n=1 Tax=Candidatus Sediminicultor quintus TaxID=1797291 RepID=A0A1F5A970_9BACT|nr:MAG: hypothetical protein A2V47_02225 [Candidatus Atribacteria bacterium RBG_19FT_COMBO_35_14]